MGMFVFAVTKSCPSLQPHELSLSSSSVRGTFQARTLEWVAISFSRNSLASLQGNRETRAAGPLNMDGNQPMEERDGTSVGQREGQGRFSKGQQGSY